MATVSGMGNVLSDDPLHLHAREADGKDCSGLQLLKPAVSAWPG
jgi:hypothetical protein